MQYYYVENTGEKSFAILEQPRYKAVDEIAKEKSVELFVRPMCGTENWDNTIFHEQLAGKTYKIIDNRDDALEFLGIEA